MRQLMKKDVRYLVDSPLFDRFRIRNGFLEPGQAGWIARANGTATAFEGKLFYSSPLGSLPREWSGEIRVSGLTVTLPNGIVAAIYEEGQERPSTKTEREAIAFEHHSKHLTLIESVIEQIIAYLGSSAASDVSDTLKSMLVDVQVQDCRGLISLHGYTVGLQAASVITHEQAIEINKMFKAIAVQGDVVRYYQRPGER